MLSKALLITILAHATVLCACAGSNLKPDADPKLTDRKDAACVSETASRIPPSQSDCSAYGRTYSNEDIDRTGATTAAEALKLLDPSVTVR